MVTPSAWSRRRFLGTALSTAFVAPVSGRVVPPLADDARLAAPIMVARKEATLDDLLTEISGSRKNLLLTRRQSGSWQIGWYRATVFAENVPAHTILADIAELFGYDWQVAENPLVYVLYQPSESRRWEERLRDILRAQGIGLLQELARCSRESWEEWRKRRDKLEDSPEADAILRKNVFYLARFGPHSALHLLDTLTPLQMRTLVEEGELTLSRKGTTGAQQDCITHILSEQTGLTRSDSAERLSKEEASRAIARDLTYLQQFGFRITIRANMLTGIPTSFSYAIPPVSYSAGMFTDVAKERGMPSLLPVCGRPYPPDAAEPTTPPVPPSHTDEEMDRLPFPAGWSLKQEQIFTPWADILDSLKPHLLPRFRIYSDDLEGRRIGRFSADTALLARTGQNPSAAQLPQLLGVPTLPDMKRLSMTAGLDALCDAYGKLWWRRGDALFFRHRLWFREQEYGVPPQLEPTLARLLSQNPPNIDGALLLLARLPPKQFMGYAARVCAAYTRSRPLPVPAGFLQGDGQPLALLYARLRADQRRRVLSSDGLPFAAMDTDQQAEYARIVYFDGGPDALDRMAKTPFRAEMQEMSGTASDKTPRFSTLRLSLPYRDQIAWATIGIVFPKDTPTDESEGTMAT
jgi:hypothetical protein